MIERFMAGKFLYIPYKISTHLLSLKKGGIRREIKPKEAKIDPIAEAYLRKQGLKLSGAYYVQQKFAGLQKPIYENKD